MVFSVTVSALDSSNNVVATYSGTVHFTSSDGQASLLATDLATFHSASITVVNPAPDGTSMRFACGPTGCGPLTQTATVTNIGSTPVTMTSIAITGTFSQPFSQTNTCPTSLGAGQSCTITVAVNSRPTNGSVSSGQVLISDNGGASPQTIFLTYLDF
jgi:hypothetical protein